MTPPALRDIVDLMTRAGPVSNEARASADRLKPRPPAAGQRIDPVAAAAEGLSDNSVRAFAIFRRALVEAYGDRVHDVAVFGSRARGDARPGSDLDVVVVLAGAFDSYREKMRMADLAFDAIVETGVHVQSWPVATEAWKSPDTHANPSLVRAMRREAVRV